VGLLKMWTMLAIVTSVPQRGLSVCMSVTLVPHTKAIGGNGMPFGTNTCVWLQITLY